MMVLELTNGKLVYGYVLGYIELGEYIYVEKLCMLGRFHSEILLYPRNAYVYKAFPLKEFDDDFILTLQKARKPNDFEEINKLWENDTKGEAKSKLIKNGLRLYYYPTYRQDKEMVLLAVRAQGLALMYASEKLKEDVNIVREAIYNNLQPIVFCNPKFHNTNFILSCCLIFSIQNTNIKEFNIYEINSYKSYFSKIIDLNTLELFMKYTSGWNGLTTNDNEILPDIYKAELNCLLLLEVNNFHSVCISKSYLECKDIYWETIIEKKWNEYNENNLVVEKKYKNLPLYQFGSTNIEKALHYFLINIYAPLSENDVEWHIYVWINDIPLSKKTNDYKTLYMNYPHMNDEISFYRIVYEAISLFNKWTDSEYSLFIQKNKILNVSHHLSNSDNICFCYAFMFTLYRYRTIPRIPLILINPFISIKKKAKVRLLKYINRLNTTTASTILLLNLQNK